MVDLTDATAAVHIMLTTALLTLQHIMLIRRSLASGTKFNKVADTASPHQCSTGAGVCCHTRRMTVSKAVCNKPESPGCYMTAVMGLTLPYYSDAINPLVLRCCD